MPERTGLFGGPQEGHEGWENTVIMLNLVRLHVRPKQRQCMAAVGCKLRTWISTHSTARYYRASWSPGPLVNEGLRDTAVRIQQ